MIKALGLQLVLIILSCPPSNTTTYPLTPRPSLFTADHKLTSRHSESEITIAAKERSAQVQVGRFGGLTVHACWGSGTRYDAPPKDNPIR